jgi:hypothetical protein
MTKDVSIALEEGLDVGELLIISIKANRRRTSANNRMISDVLETITENKVGNKGPSSLLEPKQVTPICCLDQIVLGLFFTEFSKVVSIENGHHCGEGLFEKTFVMVQNIIQCLKVSLLLWTLH